MMSLHAGFHKVDRIGMVVASLGPENQSNLLGNGTPSA